MDDISPSLRASIPTVKGDSVALGGIGLFLFILAWLVLAAYQVRCPPLTLTADLIAIVIKSNDITYTISKIALIFSHGSCLIISNNIFIVSYGSRLPNLSRRNRSGSECGGSGIGPRKSLGQRPY